MSDIDSNSAENERNKRLKLEFVAAVVGFIAMLGILETMLVQASEGARHGTRKVEFRACDFGGELTRSGARRGAIQ